MAKDKAKDRQPGYTTGRPTSFKPEYCQMLIEHMKTGMSYDTFSKIAKCSITTLYNWEEQFPIFLEAKKEAMQENLSFWEAKSIEALEEVVEYNDKGKPIYRKAINPTVLIFNLKNRFPEKWRDVKQLDQKINQTTTISLESLDLVLLSEMLKDVKRSEEVIKQLNEPEANKRPDSVN